MGKSNINKRKIEKTPAKELDAKTAELEEKHNFYRLDLSTRNGKKEWKIIFDKELIIELLRKHGFYRFDLNIKEITYIKVTNNLVEFVNIPMIIDFFQDYVQNLEEFTHEKTGSDGEVIEKTVTAKWLHNKLINNLGFFDNKILERLRLRREINPNKDTKTEIYLYYQNTVVKVIKEGIQLIDYKDFDRLIWKHEILKRDFQLLPKEVWQAANFNKFLHNITTVKPNDKRYEALLTYIGYCMHNYLHKPKYLIAFLDGNIDLSDDNPKGRSGKSLICKALGYMLNPDYYKDKNFVMINGKQFNPADIKAFAEAAANTEIFAIDDLKKSLSHGVVEELFSVITNGLPVRLMNMDTFRIIATVLISSNRALNIQSASANARTKKFEFTNYYHDDFGPDKDFGETFFSEDWSDLHWNQFDNIMINGCLAYLIHEYIVEPAPMDFNKSTVVHNTSIEFFNFMNTLLINKEPIDMLKITLSPTRELTKGLLYDAENRVEKKELFNRFTEKYDTPFKDFKQRHFNNWVQTYIQYSDSICAISQESNGTDYFIFFEKNPETLNLIQQHKENSKK